MKTFFAAVGQLVLLAVFVALFAGGGFLSLFHMDPFGAPHWLISHPTPLATRFFVPTGLLLMSVLWVIVVAIEAAAKRLRSAGLWTTAAYVLALVIGLVMKFGWVQTDL